MINLNQYHLERVGERRCRRATIAIVDFCRDSVMLFALYDSSFKPRLKCSPSSSSTYP